MTRHNVAIIVRKASCCAATQVRRGPSAKEKHYPESLSWINGVRERTRMKRLSVLQPLLCVTSLCILCTYYAYTVRYNKTEKIKRNSDRRGVYGRSEMTYRTARSHDEPKRVKNILVVAYQRSGSTFTSKILEHGGDKTTFFSMEPLWQIYRQCYRRMGAICCPNNKCRSPMNQHEEIGYTLSVLQSIYACNLTELPHKILMSFNAFPSTGSDYIQSAKCFQKDTPEMPVNYVRCLNHLTHLCKSSSVIIIKTLRLDIELAMLLQSYLDNLYVIHLVRDPRAILSSRVEFQSLTSDPLSVQSKALCLAMHKNSMDVQRFTNCFTLQFEQLATEPETIVKGLYRFCELNFTSNTSRWLQQFTNPATEELRHPKTNSLIIPTPRNASQVYQKWRSLLSWQAAEIIQRSCDQLLSTLGLHVFTAETELRNLSFNVISK